MNSHVDDEIKSVFDKAMSIIDSKESLEHSKRMIMYRFLSEIERLADEKNINRKELASLIDTSASYITQLFRGHKLINLETIAKFQDIFDITFEIKAIPNQSDVVFKGINVDNDYVEPKTISGFWAFHTFAPVYKNEANEAFSSNNIMLQYIA